MLLSPEDFDYFFPKKGAALEKRHGIDPEMYKLVASVLPSVALKEAVPPDGEATRESNLWKEPYLKSTGVGAGDE